MDERLKRLVDEKVKLVKVAWMNDYEENGQKIRMC